MPLDCCCLISNKKKTHTHNEEHSAIRHTRARYTHYYCIAGHLAEEVLACQSNLGQVLLQVLPRKSVHLHLARSADRYTNASHGFRLHAPHSQSYQLQAQILASLCSKAARARPKKQNRKMEILNRPEALRRAHATDVAPLLTTVVRAALRWVVIVL